VVHMGRSLGELNAIADFACHYGRLIRALRIAAPNTTLYGCDIDTQALAFCKSEFNAQPFHTAWSDSARDIPQVDLLVCVSLLTHTKVVFFDQMLALWGRMINPCGLLVFTFLGDRFLKSWASGEMAHYGAATADEMRKVSEDFYADGHAFHGYRTPYSETEYGVGFLSADLVKTAIAKSRDFVLLELRDGPMNEFGQDVAVAYRRAS
jgi:SAM-dependent methyltransferase